MSSDATTIGAVKYDASIDLPMLQKSVDQANKIVKKSYDDQAQAAKKASQSSSGSSSPADAANARVNALKKEAQDTANSISQYVPQIQKQFLTVERANNQVYSAMTRSSQAIQKYGVDSVEATRATNSLNVAVQNQFQAQTRLESSLRSTGNTASSTSSLMQVGFVSATTAAIALGAAIGTNLEGAINRTDIINNFPKIMQNFGIGADDATTAMNRLVAGVHGLPTSLNDITQLAEAFTPMTNNIGDATTLALAFNDALLAGGQNTQVQTAAMEQFRQALAKGMPQLQDWRSLETAMPAQLQQIGEQLGLGAGKLADYANNGQGLYNAMQDGKLSLNDFANALVELDRKGSGVFPSFEQQAKNASTGIGTSITVLSQDIQNGIGKVFNAIGSENIQNTLSLIGNDFTNTFNAIASGINFIQGLGSWVGPTIAGITTATVAFGGLAAGVYVSVKAFAALRAAMTVLSGPVGIIVGLLSAAAGIAAATSFDSMTSSLGDSADEASSLDDSTQNFNLNLQGAADSAKDVSKQIGKINDQMQAAGDNYRYSLAQLVAEKNESIATLTKTLTDEQTAYNDAYNERLASFNKTQNDELLTHQQKTQALQNQIDFLTKYNTAANQQQLSETQFALAQEDAQYQQSTQLRQTEFDAQTQTAKDEYEKQRIANQQKLDEELALLQKHRQDVLDVQNVMLLDEIDTLKKQRDEQLKSLQQQRQDIIDNLSSAGTIGGTQGGKNAGEAFSNNFTSLVTDLTKTAEEKIRKLVNYGNGVKSSVQQDKNGNYYVVPEFATGGYTGPGAKHDVAGIVHAGEYVLPQEDVDQTTGQPNWGKIMGGANTGTSVTVHNTFDMSGIMASGKSDLRNVAVQLGKLINESVKAKTGKTAIEGI